MFGLENTEFLQYSTDVFRWAGAEWHTVRLAHRQIPPLRARWRATPFSSFQRNHRNRAGRLRLVLAELREQLRLLGVEPVALLTA